MPFLIPEGYELYKSPLPLTFEDWKPKEAAMYFEFFMTQIPIRLAVLERTFALVPMNPQPRVDFTVDSLTDIGRWYQTQIGTRPLTKSELDTYRQKIPSDFQYQIEPWTFDVYTWSLIMDLGIYFAEMLRSRHPFLSWTWIRKPKNAIDFHRPVLGGFINDHRLEPSRILNVLTRDAIDGIDLSTQMPKTFLVWDNAALKSAP